MRNIFKPITIAIAAVTIVSFIPPIDKNKKKRKFIDTANMNPEVKPGDNFFRYANGTWLKSNPVPASKTLGSFDALREEAASV
jgi:putative endopeptidase